MGDFHQYYYGTKTAPYLTVFIGGNHEASNHLFELYYGGWAAPNIYYLGAANVVKLGPLKIAAMSGIYKEHDYNKPHYERLPYSDRSMRTIYHQREIDVRKLLAYRSQVDIGISHDWPHQVEWLGDYPFLFRRKDYFLQDALNGELGSKAAASVMDRLRPSHWFSGHMHFKYAALKDYEKFDQSWVVQAQEQYRPRQRQVQILKRRDDDKDREVPVINNENTSMTTGNPAAAAVSGWTSFGNTIEAHDAEIYAQEQQAEKEHEEQFGKRTKADYKFEETFKEVSVAQDGNAQSRQNLSPESKVAQQIPQLDGACFSALKRRRKSSPLVATEGPRTSRSADQTDGAVRQAATIMNPDAIDINISDSEDDNSIKPILPQGNGSQTRHHAQVTNPDALDVDMSGSEEDEGQKSMLSQGQGTSHSKTDEYRHPTGRKLCLPYQEFLSPARSSPKLASIKEMRSKETVQAFSADVRPTELSSGISLPVPYMPQPSLVNDADLNSSKGPPANDLSQRRANATTTADQQAKRTASIDSYVVVDRSDIKDYEQTLLEMAPKPNPSGEAQIRQPSHSEQTKREDEVPEELRAQLASMSTTFAPEEKVERTSDLPFPAETIPNKITRFLALSKVEKGRDLEFLQLLEIDPLGREAHGNAPSRPLKLEYDPGWLAILRAFAPELVLGGAPHDKIPPHRGDTYYREKVVEEEKWIQENVVDKGLLAIPENFEVTTRTVLQDGENSRNDGDMPREQSNPQTARFCELIGIENKFDFSEQDRDARVAAGPPGGVAEEHRGGFRHSGGGGGGGRGRGGLGGGRGRGRGRGRGGRGRGRW